MPTASNKRIGIVDYHLDNFHANTYLAALRGPLERRGYTVAGATAWIAEPSRAWADRNGVAYLQTVADLSPAVDCFMVLAPSNPEVHEEMCRQVLPMRKPTFVDKTFAPDLATARRIFDLADECNVPIQTTSALRTTNVQKFLRSQAKPVRNLYVYAGGKSFAEYGIHPVELTVSCLGDQVGELMRLGPANHPLLVLRYGDDRTAVIDFSEGVDVPFAVTIVTDEASHHVIVDLSALFVDAMSDILDFFDAGKPFVPRGETLLVRRILDAALAPAAHTRFDQIHSPLSLRMHAGAVSDKSDGLAILEGLA